MSILYLNTYYYTKYYLSLDTRLYIKIFLKLKNWTSIFGFQKWCLPSGVSLPYIEYVALRLVKPKKENSPFYRENK